MKKLLLSFAILFVALSTHATIYSFNVSSPGDLQSLLGNDIEVIDSIKLSGVLNNNDVLVLKKMTDSYKLVYIDLYNSSTPIGSNAFEGSSGIRHIILPQNCTSIGYLAFAHCSNLEHIELSKKVSSLANGCLRGCGRLKEIVLPKSVRSIGTQCFDGGTVFTDIYCEGTIPPTASTNAWGYFGSTVHVPIGAKETYQFANGWMNFEDIVEYEVANTHLLTIEKTGEGSIYIDGIITNEKQIVIDNDETKTIKIVPNDDWIIGIIECDGRDISNQLVNGEFELEPSDNNCLLKVKFEKMPVRINLKTSECGYLVQEVEYGATFTCCIIPSDGWKINTVTFNDQQVTSELTNDYKYITPALYADAILSVSFESTQSAINSARVSNAKVYGSNGEIVISGTERGDAIYVYDEGGKVIAQTIANSNEQKMAIQAKGIYIVKVGGKTVKVCL